MALQSQAALLDELMGIDRNNTVKREITWEDESVCKYYLAGFCPHELFVNTKMTLGECPKYHNSKLLDDYKNSNQYLKMGFERRLKKFLEGYLIDVNKKIQHNSDRLRHGLLSGTEIAIKERIKKLEKEVNDLVELIEQKANEGKIQESSDLSLKLEDIQRDLKYDKIELERQREFSRDKMEDVCKVCGAYISKTDPRNSMENHIIGRIHCSYVKISEEVEKLNGIIRSSGCVGGYYDDKDEVRSTSRASGSSRYHQRGYDEYYDNDEECEYYRSRSRSGYNGSTKSSHKHHKHHRSHRILRHRSRSIDYPRNSNRYELEEGEY